MAGLVSAEEAKIFLRLEYNEDDQYIEQLIATAREICESYLRYNVTKNCPERVHMAMLLLIGHFYENRESETNKELPQTVFDLLRPLREPRW